jgi:hypothetical protein
MRVNEAGKHVFARRINDLRAPGRREIAVNPGDGFVFAPNVGGISFIGGNNLAVLDEERHARYVAWQAGKGNWVEAQVET